MNNSTRGILSLVDAFVYRKNVFDHSLMAVGAVKVDGNFVEVVEPVEQNAPLPGNILRKNPER
jgi:hypothetical protein